jgi:hypothetical protein
MYLHTSAPTANAFACGLTQSLGDTVIAPALTAARWAVLGWEWYTASFFSADARRRYDEIGTIVGIAAVAVVALGMTARIYTQHWVDAEVAAATSAPAPAVETAPDVDPFCPTVNEHYATIAATVSAPVAIARVKVAAPITTLTSAQLRKECSAQGIKWRNAHGKGRHLSKCEMRSALDA